MRPSGHHVKRNIRILPIQQAEALSGDSFERHADALGDDLKFCNIVVQRFKFTAGLEQFAYYAMCSRRPKWTALNR